MNDIDITFIVNEQKYYLGIETMYSFDKGRDGERLYIKRLFDVLTEWMVLQNYNINDEVWIYEVFTQGKNINTGFDTIEELYTNFKFMVNGFCEVNRKE